MKSNRAVCIVVYAEGVGKTSIIEVLITATFEENVQAVLPVLVVPKDVTPEKVKVSIVDTPSGLEQEARVDAELKLADVVVLVYSVYDENSQKRVSSHWLKKFRASELAVPIILVGNKIDTRATPEDPEQGESMARFIKPIMDNYREVDVCIECSAKTVSNISEVFYFAQKAVLHPTGPLYDVDKHALKRPAANALRRIFRICDKDRDGGLNDKELNDFQYACFNVHLKPEELAGVKKVVQESTTNDGIRPDGSISVEGFIFLHTLFVQKGRLETTWIVLRKFGYDDNMRLVLEPKEMVKCSEDQSIELSEQGKRFLHKTFAEADKDGDGLLTKEQLESIFAEHPDDPFTDPGRGGLKNCVTATGPKGMSDFTSFDTFIARWALLIQNSVEDALLAFAYIGYTDPPSTALKVTKSHARDRYYKKVSREVLSVFVLGDKADVNCNLVRGLAGRPAATEAVPGLASAAVFNEPEETPASRVLVMRAADSLGDLVKGNLVRKADVVCIAFDASSAASFEHAKSVWNDVQAIQEFMVPVVFVASVDNGEDEDVLAEADALCLEAQLPTPVRIALQQGETAGIYADLLGVATHPDVACPDYYAASGSMPSSSTVIKVAVGTVLASGALYGAKRLYDYLSTKPNTN